MNERTCKNNLIKMKIERKKNYCFINILFILFGATYFISTEFMVLIYGTTVAARDGALENGPTRIEMTTARICFCVSCAVSLPFLPFKQSRSHSIEHTHTHTLLPLSSPSASTAHVQNTQILPFSLPLFVGCHLIIYTYIFFIHL